MPSYRQFVLQASYWSAMAWFVAGLWVVNAQNVEAVDALTRYYAIRAPLVGALAGLVWAPALLVLRTRWWLFRVAQGIVVGPLVGGTTTILLLWIWPGDMQNTRFDAIKWALLFWKLYWYLFLPSSVTAGVGAVWIGTLGTRGSAATTPATG